MTDCTCNTFPSSLGNVTFGASVGIGTTSPAAPLDVPATVRVAGTGSQSIWFSTADQATGMWLRNDGSSSVISSNGPDMYFGYIGTAKNLRFMGGGTVTQMILTAAGQVGIGNNFSPAYPLDVNGTVRATGMLMGGDILLSGALKDSTGNSTHVDAGGCYYAG